MTFDENLANESEYAFIDDEIDAQQEKLNDLLNEY